MTRLQPEAAAPEAAVIAPFPALAQLAAEQAAALGWPVRLAVGDLAEGYRLAESLQAEGVKLFVSRGGTARMLKKLGPPVVEIGVSACDILEGLKALERARPGFRGPVGLIGFENILAKAHRLAGLLDVDLRLAAIEDEGEIPGRLEALQAGGVDMVLGDRIVTARARAAGLTAALVASGAEAVAEALREARERLEMLARAAEDQRRHLTVLSQFKTVLDGLEDPVLIVDRAGTIRHRNQAAAELWPEGEDRGPAEAGWTDLPAFARAFDRGLVQTDQLASGRGRNFLLDFRPIAGSLETAGEALTAVIARSAEKVETSERRLRQKVYFKGHVARYRFGDIVTEDPAFRRFLERAAEYARSDSAILIEGESGVGKEMLAQSIHNHKFGPQAPFVALNCAALPANLLESELFGYAPGAFTGALKEGRKGFFELAHGGTLFLDEVGEMPPELQNRLLRALEEKAVLPVGGDRLLPVRARILAATNADLAEAVRRGRFRQDLFFRLGVLFLAVPPLRDRGRDPLTLFKKLARAWNPEFPESFWERPGLRELLLGHQWPGNAREVKNVVERLAITTGSFTRRLAEAESFLERELAASGRLVREVPPGGGLPEEDLLRQLGLGRPRRKSELARELGVSRTTLWRRLKKLEFDET